MRKVWGGGGGEGEGERGRGGGGGGARVCGGGGTDGYPAERESHRRCGYLFSLQAREGANGSGRAMGFLILEFSEILDIFKRYLKYFL